MRNLYVLLLLLVCSWSLSYAHAEAIGWRTDGTGHYPEAEPPTEWSPEKNVVWKARMPNWSNSLPVIVGERLFVCSEPTSLVCVDTKDGRILWQRSNDYFDLLNDEEIARAKQDLTHYETLRQELEHIVTRGNGLRDKLAVDPDNVQLQEQFAQTEKEAADIKGRMKPLRTYVPPITKNITGYSSCTPVSDGQHVWVVLGTGVVACYDLKGDRQWIKAFDKPDLRYDWGYSVSPLLIGDRLLVNFTNDMTALDSRTGEILWRAPSPVKCGTPLAVRLGQKDIIFTPAGYVLNADDGNVLSRDLCNMEFVSPVLNGNVIYAIGPIGKAIQLPELAREPLGANTLWESSLTKENYYASPVVHEGLVYALSEKNIWSVLEAQTGQKVYEEKLDLGKGSDFPSVVLAGRFLYAGSNNGTTIVIEPGRQFRQVAKNQLEPCRSTPVFKGRRMYLRGLEHLYCIGQ